METSTEDKLRHLLKNKKILGIAAVILLIVGSNTWVCTLQTYSQIYTFSDSGCGEIA